MLVDVPGPEWFQRWVTPFGFSVFTRPVRISLHGSDNAQHVHHLKKLKSLEKIELNIPSLREDIVSDLQAALPDCEIVVNN